MHTNKFKYLYTTVLVMLILLTSCSVNKSSEAGLDSPASDENLESQFSSAPNANAIKKEPIVYDDSAFIEKSAEELLNVSISLSFPEGISFTPKALTDNRLIIGEAFNISTPDKNYLALYNISTRSFQKMKDIEKSSDRVHAVVSYADSEYVIFEENDQVNKSSVFYLYNIEKADYQVLHKLSYVETIHTTHIAREADTFYINMFFDDAIYKTYAYSIKDQKLLVIEDNNSGFPIIYDHSLYYLLIDNNKLETELVKYDISQKSKESIAQTKGSNNFYYGLYGNGADRLVLKYGDGNFKLAHLDERANEKEFLSAPWIESLQFKGDYISFLGEKRSEDRIKSQYYLFDLRNKIDYIYDGSLIFLSNKGILWIEFTVPEAEVPNGEIFSNDHSVMRYFEFKENTPLMDESNSQDGEVKQASQNKVEESQTASTSPTEKNSLNTSSESQTVQAETSNAHKKVILDVPQKIQQEWNFCAPTTVSMMLACRGIDIDQYQLAKEMLTDESFGTHNAEAIRVLNQHLFGYEYPESNQAGYRLATVTTSDVNSEEMKLFKKRLIQNIDDGYPMYYTIDNARIYPGSYGEHNVIGIGYVLDASGQDVEYIYFIDPSYTQQDSQYGGLKKISPEELFYAMLTCVEPNYGW